MRLEDMPQLRGGDKIQIYIDDKNSPFESPISAEYLRIYNPLLKLPDPQFGNLANPTLIFQPTREYLERTGQGIFSLLNMNPIDSIALRAIEKIEKVLE